MNLPDSIAREVRQLVQQALRREAVARLEFEELHAQVQALRRRLSAPDAAILRSLLPALHHLQGDRELTAAEVLGLARGELVPADDALRLAVEPFSGPGASKALGKFLSRVAGQRVGPYFLQMLPAARPKDAALYRVRRVSAT